MVCSHPAAAGKQINVILEWCIINQCVASISDIKIMNMHANKAGISELSTV